MLESFNSFEWPGRFMKIEGTKTMKIVDGVRTFTKQLRGVNLELELLLLPNGVQSGFFMVENENLRQKLELEEDCPENYSSLD
jgi:hypothetical protein